jgi:hypothetical protein
MLNLEGPLGDEKISQVSHVFRLMTGRPLRASEIQCEKTSTFSGLPALSLDALTSVAYGPEAIMVVLATDGLGALHPVVPITVVIVALLAILVFPTDNSSTGTLLVVAVMRSQRRTWERVSLY